MGALLGADKLVGSKKIGHLLLTDIQYDECGQFHEYALKVLKGALVLPLEGYLQSKYAPFILKGWIRHWSLLFLSESHPLLMPFTPIFNIMDQW